MQPEEVSAGGETTAKVSSEVTGVDVAAKAAGVLSAAVPGYGATAAVLAMAAQIVTTLQKTSDEAAEQSKMLNESAQQKIDVEGLNRGRLARVQQGMESGAAANTYGS